MFVCLSPNIPPPTPIPPRAPKKNKKQHVATGTVVYDATDEPSGDNTVGGENAKAVAAGYVGPGEVAKAKARVRAAKMEAKPGVEDEDVFGSVGGDNIKTGESGYVGPEEVAKAIAQAKAERKAERKAAGDAAPTKKKKKKKAGGGKAKTKKKEAEVEIFDVTVGHGKKKGSDTKKKKGGCSIL